MHAPLSPALVQGPSIERHLIKVLLGSAHLLPGLVHQLDADAEELFKEMILPEEHRVKGLSRLRACGEKDR